jgi:NAD(P)-dependent dehydrogenase (short-subunit alcohol dehydrogenase family)
LAERTVLITGCSSGFGLGLARAFRESGWDVVAGLRNLADAPPELHGVRVIPLDLDCADQIVAAAAQVGRLDCLINNAGYALAGPFATYTVEQMQRQLQVNVLGPALLTQTLLPALRRAGGRIICISSLAGETGVPMNSLYCASKYAIEGLYEALRYELASSGVQVALVEPGGFRTRFAVNMQWGARPPAPRSLEAAQLEGFQAMLARILARPGRRPERVVAAIVRLAEMTTMPLRTRIGGDVRLLRRLKRWLPERVATTLIAAAFRRMAGKRIT